MLGDANKLFAFKSLLTTPSNLLSFHLKQTFPPIIWIFTEGGGDGIESRLPFKIFSTLNYACEISVNNDLSLLLVSWHNVARESDVVPWTIYNGSFTIGCKIDGQKVGSDLSYKSPHVPAELCSRLSKRNKVIAPSGKSKWVIITSFIFHAFAAMFFSFSRNMNDSWIR